MKRFTETTKWDDPWFLDLSACGKLFWLYLCDKCDNAGVIHIHERKMHFELGISRSTEDLLQELGDRVTTLDNGKLYIPRFTAFQFGELKGSSNLHKNVLQLLKNHGLPYPSDTLHEGFTKGPGKGKGKGKGKGTGKEEEKDEVFEDAWVMYLRKGTKKKSLEQWKKLTPDDHKVVVESIPSYFLETPDAQFRKDFERYLSHRMFEAVAERAAAGCLLIPTERLEY